MRQHGTAKYERWTPAALLDIRADWVVSGACVAAPSRTLVARPPRVRPIPETHRRPNLAKDMTASAQHLLFSFQVSILTSTNDVAVIKKFNQIYRSTKKGQLPRQNLYNIQVVIYGEIKNIINELSARRGAGGMRAHHFRDIRFWSMTVGCLLWSTEWFNSYFRLSYFIYDLKKANLRIQKPHTL
ncbi:unnamed protein product [Pieris brassicae]|uniref:Uncharacterized protein n=1 Tax=Pieris brassicae TaxID=7116 RepID=A0A9P0T5P9_PIEBR|nr:unnamed protein product [Pieris brassicae]